MMSNRNKIIAFFLVLIAVCPAGFSQKKEMSLAQTEFNDLQYSTAADYYRKAIEKFRQEDARKQYCTFMLAECYTMMNEPDRAQPFYKQLIEENYGNDYPVIYLRYASVLRTQGDVAEAKQYYAKYLKEDPDNAQAKSGLKSCDWILSNRSKKAQVNIYSAESLNSAEDDFSPAFLDKDHSRLIFTSNRPSATGKNRDQWNGAAFSDLFKSTISLGDWGNPELFDIFGSINTDIHEGTPSPDTSYKTLYFTRCDRMAGKKSYCQVWKTEKPENRWLAPKLVFADTTANIGQPGISRDGLSIVFSSDMKGGKGGNDIWVARRESKDKNFGKPVLLDPVINTSSDELFPYFFDDTTLYFASSGHEGYGGLDLFRSVRRGNAWSTPENLLAPVNSGYDDFGILVMIPGEEGYFSSNRPGGKGGDDIYRFTRRNLLFTVSGHVKDNMTLLSIASATVYLVSEHRDTSVVQTDPQGFYLFDTLEVREDTDYELIFKKDNYFAVKEPFSTKPNEDDFNFIIGALLGPIPEKPIVLPDILYELDKWDLLPQYQDSLMQLVGLLKDNETLVIELRSHTDSRASYEYNDILSQKRAQSVVDFLVSRGIDPGRLVAKGYGERVFRVLDKDILRENYLFKAGTELNDRFINSLPTNEIREAAYQLNRRTEFAVLAKDYRPVTGKTSGQLPAIQLISDTTALAIGIELTPDGKIMASGYINDYGASILIRPDSEESFLDEAVALELLKKGAIGRNDFTGSFEEIMVDDHLADNALLTIRRIRLGDVVISNAVVRIRKDSGQSLLLGKDLLEKAGNYKIDTEKQQLIFR